jgi:hypothetical protein
MVKLLKISHFAVTEPLIAMPILVMFLVHQGDSSSCWGRDSEGGISLLYHHLYFRSFNLSYSHSISVPQQPFLLIRDEEMKFLNTSQINIINSPTLPLLLHCSFSPNNVGRWE